MQKHISNETSISKKSLELANWLTWRADIANKQTDRQTDRQTWVKGVKGENYLQFCELYFHALFFSPTIMWKWKGNIEKNWWNLKYVKYVKAQQKLSIYNFHNFQDQCYRFKLFFSFLKHDKRAIIQKRFYFSPISFLFSIWSIFVLALKTIKGLFDRFL
jgi:hypothetical protein